MTADLSSDVSALGLRAVIPVIECDDLDATLAFFREQLGFRIETISPADSPRTVVISGHGGMLRLQRVDGTYVPGTIQLLCQPGVDAPPRAIVAPNGTRIECIQAEPAIDVPPIRQSLVISAIASSPDFGVGRAGMTYRDLIPGRQGGRFIASHIRIQDAGPVPDYVHFHRVRFQMIFVRRGWVKVVYQDQGEPFIMHAGDCVLQPPTIRHQVLESSAGLEVIEVGCPAEHDTIAEHQITLPTERLLPDRRYEGQGFVRHQAATSAWVPFRYPGFTQQDLGIGQATDGLAGARVVRSDGGESWPMAVIENEFLFSILIDGAAQLVLNGDQRHQLVAGDSFVIPADQPYGLQQVSEDLRLLEVSLPADLTPRLLAP